MDRERSGVGRMLGSMTTHTPGWSD